MQRVTLILLLLILASAGVSLAQGEAPLLLRMPTVSREQVVFCHAGDLWAVSRQGGDARRLTAGVGAERDPLFSPDGTLIAFTGEYDGNTDVYTIPAAGGVPRRLTYHPAPDTVAGWHPDGKRVLFRSFRNSYSRFARLFTIEVDGSFPEELPLPMAEEGAYSPDGSRLAYVPLRRSFTAWKRYRGGTATPVWIADLSDSSIEKLPRKDSNDFNPMWVGDRIYFLSDRNGPVTLFAFDPGRKKVTQVLKNEGLDLKSASAGPGAIVYEQFGSLHLFELPSGKARRLDIRLTGDFPEVRPRFEKVAGAIRSFGLSPTGARAVFEARGEIVTVPAEKGDPRNLTNTPAVHERDPAWSPDGKWIAYFSDESGEYALHLRDQTGRGEVRKVSLGEPPSFYYQPTWSPDSKKIAFTDRRLSLWCLDLERGAPTRIDTNHYDNWNMQPAWSPDSRWLAYVKMLKSRMSAVFVHSLADGETRQVTDGMSDAAFPLFDRGGKYLYFAASTDIGPRLGFIDMSGRYDRPFTRSIYVAVLRKEDPSPLAPESDEEKSPDETGQEESEEKGDGQDGEAGEGGEAGEAGEGAPKTRGKSAREPVEVRIDFEGIDQRILALPITGRSYTGMAAGKPGILFLAESAPVGAVGVNGRALHRFDLKSRKTSRFLEGIGGFVLSHNGEKLLYTAASGGRMAIVPAAKPPSPGSGALSLAALEVRVEPKAEWEQMYREVWRIERDFFYDPNHHGLDLKATEKRYQPYLARLACRDDLNYLFTEMLGELSVGHLYVRGGDSPEPERVPGGLLGADYARENGRYRFARIYTGENWNPDLRAPLTEPGVNVREGDYLLAVNGRDLRADENVYARFEGTAGKQTVLTVGPNPDGSGSREVTVVPVETELALRNRSWIDANRRKVTELSGGRLAYVYLPNTAAGGYSAFNRYFFAQVDREGAVIDERFNGGGAAADYIIDAMRRPLMNYWAPRYGADVSTPGLAIFGPKAMIVNEYAGSGGDAMPWYFRKAGLGPLIGKRTWGGLVGIGGYPVLMDGGTVTAPHFAFWNPDGSWEVENHGVTPDIEVEFDPKAWRQGRDPQLEKAVEVVLEALRQKPLPKHRRPPYPNYHRRAGSGKAGD